MRGGGHWKLFGALIILVVILGMAPGIPTSDVITAAAQPAAAMPRLQGALVAMVSPTACPSGGCAAGQRLNMRFDFEPGSAIVVDAAPNVKACVYAPVNWAVDLATVTADAAGELTGREYLPPAEGAGGCTEDTQPPAGYNLILERLAVLEQNTFVDTLGFGFRVGREGTGMGRVVARLFARTSGGWQSVQQATSTPTLTIVPAAERTFIANDAATCGTTIPCYINSGEDSPGGVGTGLKDAVDAAPSGATIYVLGNYNIKSSTVVVNKPLTIAGHNNSRITFAGNACEAAMLRLERGVTVRELLVTDGGCASPNRNLIEVDSPEQVLIERNDLLNGADAITLHDNEGALIVRFNDIRGNGGHALRGLEPTRNGPLTLTANNMIGNRGVPVVDCAEGASEAAANRLANHNFWGGASPNAEDTHCQIEGAKRLGMAIALEEDIPGVRGQLVTITDTKTYNTAFDRKIGYARQGGERNFPLYIIDHGYASAGGPPFSFVRGGESPSPCSNYWDVYLPNGEEGSGALELYFKYDRSPACLATINSTQYCDQTTTPAKIPLYWYDPRSSTSRWLTTASKINADTEGQNTTCNTEANEIRLAVDSSGRPSLSQDLNYMPIMVGVPVIKSFMPLASAQTINVTWTTNNEPDVVGFYVLRGQTSSALSPISDLIPHTGTALAGRAYSFVDAGRTNGVTSFYRLQVLRSDGNSIYSSIVEIAANRATITPTRTPAPTITPRPTNTRFPTFIPTRFPTRIPPTRFPTMRPLTPVPTQMVLATRRPTLDIRTPGAAQTMTVWAQTPAFISGGGFPDSGDETTEAMLTPLPGMEDTTGTPGAGTAVAALITATPTPTPTRTPAVIQGEISGGGVPAASAGASPWLSLLIGLGAGLVATGGIGAAWYFLFLKR
jgi:hypothetical protein